YSSIGYSTEVIYLYLATQLTPGETNFDDNESIEILEFDLPELKKMVFSGEIEDAKTLAAILLVESIMGKETIQ
ncbi:MAG: ADP-ribose pyrophosphatase, partial [Bacillota bacterium]